MRNILLALFILASVFSGSATATPILDGQTVQTTYLYPDTSTVFTPSVNTLVGPGVELLNYAGFADIDFSDTNVKITTTRDAGINNVAFDGFRFFDVFGTIPNDLMAVLNPATTYAGFTAARLAGGDQDTLFVNVANLPGLKGQVISIDLVERSAAAVPEPATLTLLGGGLATFLARRRKRARAVGAPR